MSRVTYKPFSLDKKITIWRGIDGHIESNSTTHFIDEWIVFPLDMGDNNWGQIRLPLQVAREQGLVCPTEVFEYTAEDMEAMSGCDD